MKSKKSLLLVAVASLLTLAACGPKPKPASSQDPGSSVEAAVIEGIAAADGKTTGIELAVGETGNIPVEVTGTGDFNKDVLWSSEDATVASVAADGVITGVKVGKTNVIAKAAGDESKTVSFEVEVVKASATVALNFVDIELEPEGEKQLLASVKTRGAIEKTVTFSTSDDGIADVDNTGLVTANAVGEATITATTVDGNTAKCVVYVNNPYIKTIRLSATSIYLVAEGSSQTLTAEVNAFGEIDKTIVWSSSNTAVATVDPATGVVTPVAEGECDIYATAGGKSEACHVKVAPVGSKNVANGSYSYVYSSGEERQKILGALEKWAVENKLTGLTLYGDGGYVMYNPRIQKGSNTYLPGYGFGILGEGDITADLAAEQNAAWKRYYHSYETSDPSSLNYMDDKGSVVGDLIGYVSSGYFDVEMNSAKTGYNWVNSLSTAEGQRPIPVGEGQNGMYKTYKFPVKVGADLKYATLSNNDSIKAFNGREVQLQDYITPYQIYYTQSYGLARSSENLKGASSLAGTEAYYNASKNGFNAEEWAKVGIRAYVDETDHKSYLEFKFNNACTPFYAMYYLASGMFAPVPEDFIKLLGGNDLVKGVATWGKFSNDGKLSPVDTYLSTGPYVTERWDKDQQIVFKKNTLFDDNMRYAIPGVHLNILAAAANDPEYAFNEFLNGKLDAVGIPSTKLQEYKSDPRTTVTSDSSTYKLNMNTCTPEQWELLFGEKGSIVQTPKSQYWKVKPAMSNKNFLSGISFALNRKDLAESLGRTATGNFFGSSYMQDPENGISYNSTQAHADAVASLQEGTDGFGYSLEKAKAAFLAASNELIAQGAYKAGDTIKIQIAWQTNAQEATNHNPIKSYLEAAFVGNPLKIECEFWAGAVWSDVYYKKMMVGQFDIGFGSVSGNTYNPLNFMEVLKSDNSAGFTLNWGVDTNSVDGTIVYDDKVWSYDALWTAADQGAYVENGQNSKLFGVYSCEALVQSDGSLLVYLYAKEVMVDANNYGMVLAVCLYATTDGEEYSDYSEYYIFTYLSDQDGNPVDADGQPLAEDAEPLANPNFVWNEDEGRYEITFPAALIAAWLEVYPSEDLYAQGIDVYFAISLLGDSSITYVGAAWEGYVEDVQP